MQRIACGPGKCVCRVCGDDVHEGMKTQTTDYFMCLRCYERAIVYAAKEAIRAEARKDIADAAQSH